MHVWVNILKECSLLKGQRPQVNFYSEFLWSKFVPLNLLTVKYQQLHRYIAFSTLSLSHHRHQYVISQSPSHSARNLPVTMSSDRNLPVTMSSDRNLSVNIVFSSKSLSHHRLQLEISQSPSSSARNLSVTIVFSSKSLSHHRLQLEISQSPSHSARNLSVTMSSARNLSVTISSARNLSVTIVFSSKSVSLVNALTMESVTLDGII